MCPCAQLAGKIWPNLQAAQERKSSLCVCTYVCVHYFPARAQLRAPSRLQTLVHEHLNANNNKQKLPYKKKKHQEESTAPPGVSSPVCVFTYDPEVVRHTHTHTHMAAVVSACLATERLGGGEGKDQSDALSNGKPRTTQPGKISHILSLPASLPFSPPILPYRSAGRTVSIVFLCVSVCV